jgi:hypothetical protein
MSFERHKLVNSLILLIAIKYFIVFIIFFFSATSSIEGLTYQIDPTNFLSILVTILLGIYIAKEIPRKLDSARVEQNLIMDEFKNLESMYRELKENCNLNTQKPPKLNYLIPTTDELTKHLHYIQFVSKNCDFHSKLNSDVIALLKYDRELRKMLTNSRTRNGFVLFGDEKIVIVKEKFDEIFKQIAISKIKLNKV